MNFRHGACTCLFLGALLTKPFALEPLDPLGREAASEPDARSLMSPIRLLCEYSHTVDDLGRVNPVNEEALFTAEQSDNGIASIRKENFDEEFTGKISEEEIAGQVEYRFRETFITEALLINRYSGKLVTTVSVARNVVLTRYGKCRSASEKLF